MSEMTSKVKVLFFASLKAKVGVNQVEINWTENARVAELRAQLAKQFPDASQVLQTCPVAVNRSFAFDQDPIPLGAEVAFFPRVSGG
jgi:molybdopterin converting factor subunit 1